MANGIRPKKRALALAGGGPAAGLHIGALAALEEHEIQFDVFSLSCIGAWVGIVYNTRPGPGAGHGSRARQTYAFFEEYCFRDDDSYEWFPLNRGFAMDISGWQKAMADFVARPGLDFDKLVPPADVCLDSMRKFLPKIAAPALQTPFEWNYWLLNDVLAVNPVTRYWTSWIFKSRMSGLSKIYYPDSPALDDAFRDGRLYDEDRPHIYHNAWRMPKDEQPGRIQIFHNRPDDARYKGQSYRKITPQSLCACSALPYIEESVPMDDGYEYTEGALVDTVNFVNLVHDHDDLDEVWVSRIVDDSQVRPARDLAGALGNLPMQFAGEVGEDDVKLFRQHLLNQTDMRPRVVEIPIHPRTQVTFDWKHSNLQRGFREGYEAVESLLAFDEELANPLAGARP